MSWRRESPSPLPPRRLARARCSQRGARDRFGSTNERPRRVDDRLRPLKSAVKRCCLINGRLTTHDVRVKMRCVERCSITGDSDRRDPETQHRAISKLVRQTNHIERFNNTLRQRVSRLVSEALSFSKKLTNHVGAIKLFICHYNLTKTPALHG